MKKIITGIALQLASVLAGANHFKSELNLISTDRNMISVSLDNNFYSCFTPELNVSGIQPGCHYVTVVKRYFRPGYRFSNRGASRDEVVYRGYVEFPAASRICASLDGYNRLSLNVQSLCFNENNSQNQVCVLPCTFGMDAASFQELKNIIASRWFDSGKLETAKQAITNSSISSAQLVELMGMLSFESSKLDLAKFSYQHTVDKQKFFIVNDAFSFESSISELNDYIRRS